MKRALTILTMLLLAHAVRGQDAPPDPRLKERDRLAEEARSLYAKGELARAGEVLSRVLTLEEQIFGAVHEETLGTHSWLAQICEALGDFDAARKRLEKALAIRTKLSGPDHWKTTDARLALADLERRAVLTNEERALLERARSEYRRSNELYRAGKRAEAIEPTNAALKIREKVLGPEHPLTATSLNNLALLHDLMGEYSKALPLYQRALAIAEKVLGPVHPVTAVNLNNLARHYSSMGEFAKALPLQERALWIDEKAWGPTHPDTATCLSNLAALYRSMGDYAKALPLHERALTIREEVLGPEHPLTATSLNNLALLHDLMGEYSKALRLCERALAIAEEVLGPEHPSTATSLNNLALLYSSLGESAKALPLFERALSIREKVHGPTHPDTATSLNNLAALCQSMGEFAKALPLHERALTIRVKVLGPAHAHTAKSLNNLAELYRSMGEYSRALPLYERALAIKEKSQGPEHPDTGTSLNNLALLYASLGESAKALPLLERALAISEKSQGPEHPDTATSLHNLAMLHGESGHVDLAYPLAVRALGAQRALLASLAVVQSERQQLRQFAGVKRALDLCLSTGAARRTDDVYAHVLGATGLVFARQAFLRAQRSRPGLSEVFAEYEGVCRRLSTRLLSTPEPQQVEARRAAIRELSARQEVLETELSKKSEEFRAERSSLALSPAELAAALPGGVALVDFVAYRQLLPREPGTKGGPRWQRRYVAFVVRPGAEVARVDLGPAERIDALVAAWRRAVGAGRIPKEGAALREALWKPVEPLLGDAETVVISPDGALSSLPFAALPGHEAGSFLVDEYRIAVVPVPRLLPSLLARRATSSPSLLLVGDVDYGAAAGAPSADVLVAARTAPRGGLAGKWEPLAGTRAEVLAVRDSFELRFPDGETKSLRRDAATEAAFREVAGKYRWLHVATHGFFAPEEVRSALAYARTQEARLLGREDRVVGFHPGLLSGIVLAGANRPVTASGDDGILTALEVASLDLSRTEMAVLSACETGLGKVAGGEGVLGLQRAFQVAGARSTVTSLWKVDDRATNLLMTLFYENLWGKRLPRAEALRQAQLQLMRDEGIRGLAVKDATAQEKPERLPPLYWAGFVLAGDWR